MGRLLYAVPLALFVPAYVAMALGGAWTWVLPVLVFVVLPLVEQTSRGSTANLDTAEEADRLADPWFDRVLYAVVVGQVGLLGVFLWRMHAGGFAPWETTGAVITMGIGCGAFGINVGHELGHHRDRAHQTMAKVLLGTSLYQHFFVEHNRGHHRRVATPDDPATARRGETVYGFWLRSVTGSLASAWKLENDRVAREGLPWWTWDNEMVRFTVAQGAALALVGGLLGPAALLGWIGAAVFGFLLLETVNYIEHYGLVRGRSPSGVYERVQPHHSWNSNRPYGRLLLFELTRHADHHAHATRKYPVLRHHDDAPELPAGYPAMIVLALIPPLFSAVMERELRAWQTRFAPAAHAAK